MYEDIERIYSFDHADYIQVVGVEVTPPRLAYIIGGILKNEEESIYDLMHYRANPELIPITEKIAKANKEIDKISNLDTDNKIGALERLKELCENKKNGKYFDTQLLAEFYVEALSLIDLSIVKETVITEREGKILLKNYLEGKKKDSSFYPVIYGLEKEDDYTLEENFHVKTMVYFIINSSVKEGTRFFSSMTREPADLI